MTRRIKHTLLALIALAAIATAEDAAKRPNIVFIFSDDHAVDAISAYKSHLADVAPTPNIDRIANEGVLFQNSFCANSICGPSRASILTGKHSHTNGFLNNNHARFDGTQVTFPKLLQKGGYQTAIIGKWHLVTDPTGFDYWEILPGQGSYYNPAFIQQDRSRKRYDGYVTDIITDRALEWLKEGRDQDKPFVLMCQHKAPHRNWSPAPRHYALFDDITVPEPESLFDDYGGNRSKTLADNAMSIAGHFYWGHDMKFHGKENPFPEHFRNGIPNGEYRRMTDEQKAAWDAAYGPKNEKLIADIKGGVLEGNAITRWKYQRYIKDYLRCIRAVDENVGRVLDYLDTSGLADNTIVIYSSDQGFYLGEHGWYDKRWMFEESLKMPFIVRWPGQAPAGKQSQTLIQNIDYAATFLAAAGLEAPAAMEGASLLPAVRNPDTPPQGWRDAIYYSYYGERTHNVAPHDGVRTGRHKLMRFPGTDEWNLIDLMLDPQEMHSVHDSDAYVEVLADLKAIYHRKRAELNVCSATVPANRMQVEWWKNRHAEKKGQARETEVDLLWIGDSITHSWEKGGRSVWDHYYADRKAFNIGYSGDRTEHVIWRLMNGELPENVQPKVAVMMIGTNNTGHSMQPAVETAAGIERILAILRDRRPEMKILLLGVFPRGAQPNDPKRKRNEDINALAATLADGKMIHFLDISDAFLDEDGSLQEQIMPDALHPNTHGYALWADAIEEQLCKLGGFEVKAPK